jgi:hypothetical protein
MTPTLVRTPALDGAHTLDKPADHRKQQIQAAGRQQDLSHDPRLPRSPPPLRPARGRSTAVFGILNVTGAAWINEGDVTPDLRMTCRSAQWPT